MKVVVIGGCGFIGSEVAIRLAERGHRVIVYDMAAWDGEKNEIEYIKGDVFDAVHLQEVLSSCDSIIHMAGLANARIAQEHPQLSFDSNLRGLQIALEAARSGKVSRFIFASSASIYGVVDRLPITENTVPKLTDIYAYHKFMAEKLAECYANSYGISITALRLFSVYGSRGKGILNILVDKAMKKEVIKLYGEKQKRDFIHVSDIAEAFVSILDINHDEYEVYNVGTGIGRTIEDIVALVREYFPDITVECGDYEGTLYDSVADITKIQKVTGFIPERTDMKLRNTIKENRDITRTMPHFKKD